VNVRLALGRQAIWAYVKRTLAAVCELALDIRAGEDTRRHNMSYTTILSRMRRSTHTFALYTCSSVSRNSKLLRKMYRKDFISIMEKRCPMHDCTNESVKE
jgi:hypothetical protein